MKEHICNAEVESIRIGFDRGIFLTCWVTLNYGGSGQGFGGYVMGKAKGKHNGPEGDAEKCAVFTADYLCLLLQCLGVEDLGLGKGKAVRVIKEDDSWGASIVGIGHITKDIWLRPKDLAADIFGKQAA